MHVAEVDTDVPLVRRLLSAQFPEWAELRIERVESAGTDNAIYRLGEDMAVRMPRIDWATGAVGKDRWLPKLAPLLPLAIPVPIARGTPGEGYPWDWSIVSWVEGEIATLGRITDLHEAATDLAQFATALHRINFQGGPPATRGVPLATRDEPVRDAIASLHGKLDSGAVTAAWDAALRAPLWDGPQVWVHGDLYDGNLIAKGGRLHAVIDWGGLGMGDPACDLIAAWSLFSGESREVFRAAVSVDDATWARGRGWALSVALIAIPYYEHTNPVIVANSWHKIAEVLADQGRRD
jgi:aminoglycoside phosphotransferase (APT) family kinase protein